MRARMTWVSKKASNHFLPTSVSKQPHCKLNGDTFTNQPYFRLSRDGKHGTLVIQQILAQSDLLTSIPGIADVTAAKLLAEIPPPDCFERPPQLAAYPGLTPGQHQSGSSVVRRGRLAKTGNAHLRRALYMPALVALRITPLEIFGEKLSPP